MTSTIDNQQAWCNEFNDAFYHCNDIIEYMTQTAKEIGIDYCPDLKALQSYIAQANSILEVGVGYGRVLSELSKFDDKHIDAIERVKILVDHVTQLFPRINTLNRDLLKLKIGKKCELILWLWSSIMEFHPSEQPKAISKLASLLSNDGYLAIELTLMPTRPRDIEISDKKFYKLSHEDTIIRGYKTSKKELLHYLQQANLEIAEVIPYQIISGERIIYIARKLSTDSNART